ncbi:hypothetical protein ACQ4M3_22725 [Leptolyngbya sp. AN03gr2]|uniref:hypothetical protein n=1 Tax=unclassified Leptolyngbya TaxID=2650499 RepID=UPI003D31150C
MDIQRRLANHYTRWNLKTSEEEQFTTFRNGVISISNDTLEQLLIEQPEIDSKFQQLFRQHSAEEPTVKSSRLIPKPNSPILIAAKEAQKLADSMYIYELTERGFGDTHVYKAIKSSSSFNDLVTILQILFWILEGEVDVEHQRNFAKKLRDSAHLTPLMRFNFAVKGKTVILYPVGEKLLDQGVIDYVISGLEKYPNVARHFEKALAFYQSGDISSYRNLLDNLRFAIEQLLKQVLGNAKSLENQKDVLLPWLKSKKIHPQTVNMYHSLLFGGYSPYQNDAVKHNEAFSVDEVEFMIYLTATFIRFVLQLADKRDIV